MKSYQDIARQLIQGWPGDKEVLLRDCRQIALHDDDAGRRAIAAAVLADLEPAAAEKPAEAVLNAPDHVSQPLQP